MKFSYKAVTAQGEEQLGEREALDRFALAREMHSQGLTLVKAEPVGRRQSGTALSRLRWMSPVRAKDLIMFAGSVGSMVGAGLSLARALEVVGRQAKNKRFKKIIAGLSERISRGESLAQALASFPDVFPPVFISMVAAGEESGNLPQAFEVVRSQLAKTYDLQRKIKGAMIYPAIIVGVIIVIAILMMVFMVPSLTALFKDLNVELPLSTRLVIGTSQFLTTHYLIVLFVVVVGGMAAFKAFRSAVGQRAWVALLLKMPAISTIMMELNAALTMRTLSSLISAGVNLVEALTTTARVVQNQRYKLVLAEAETAVQRGVTLSSIFKSHEELYPVLVGEMTEVGEETGNLSGMLLKGAQFFEDEVDQATKNLSTIIEPVLMVLIGIFVGFFAISMLGPMYSLSNAIK